VLVRLCLEKGTRSSSLARDGWGWAFNSVRAVLSFDTRLRGCILAGTLSPEISAAVQQIGLVETASISAPLAYTWCSTPSAEW
jgi:hypothetical protein